MRTNRDSLLPWAFAGTLVVVSFTINWLWEMLQMPAYAEMAGRSWSETAYRCVIASIGDVVMTLLVCGLGSLAAADIRWVLRKRSNVLVSAGLLGSLFAIAFECWALWVRRWSYTPDMPLVPVIEIGLWPILQLTLLIPVSLVVTRLLVGPAAPSSRAPSLL
jgi:hypothetical protein